MRNLHAFIKEEFGEESVFEIVFMGKNWKEDGPLQKPEKIFD